MGEHEAVARPWRSSQQTRLLCRQYPPVRRDWLDPRSPPQLPGHSPTDPFLIANAYLIHVTRLAAEIASILDKADAATSYANKADEMAEKFRAEYVTRTGRLACDTQAAYALALLFDLFGTEDQVQTARARLDWMVRWEAFKITTGFAGTPVILQVLADHGMLGHAYRMLQERDCPSWLYPVGMGATTIVSVHSLETISPRIWLIVSRLQWERWNSMLPDGTINPGQMTSFNHYALGSVCNFLHRTVGGLSPALPGWKAALVSPRPGGTICHAHTSFDSPYGPYSVTWKIEGARMVTNVAVPPNGEARVVLSGVDEKVGSGEYIFETLWEEDPDWPPAPTQGAQGNEVPAYFVP